MSQRDIDAIDKLRQVVSEGMVIAQHPRDTNERYWADGEDFGCWLYPGECVIDHDGSLYVVGMRAM